MRRDSFLTKTILPIGGHLPYLKKGERMVKSTVSYINRFVSADTIVPDPTNPQQYNRYSYTLNNALRYTDPTGHSCANPSYVSPGGDNPPEAITCKQQEKDIMNSTVKIVVEGEIFDPSVRRWIPVSGIGHATLMDGGYLLTHDHFQAFNLLENTPNAYPHIQITLYVAGEPESRDSRILAPASLKAFDMLLFDDAPETRVIRVRLPEEIFSYSGIFPAEFSGGTANLYPGQEVAQIDWDGTSAHVDWTTINSVDEIKGIITLNNRIRPGASGGGIFLGGTHIGNNYTSATDPNIPHSEAALNSLAVVQHDR